MLELIFLKLLNGLDDLVDQLRLMILVESLPDILKRDGVSGELSHRVLKGPSVVRSRDAEGQDFRDHVGSMSVGQVLKTGNRSNRALRVLNANKNVLGEGLADWYRRMGTEGAVEQCQSCLSYQGGHR